MSDKHAVYSLLAIGILVAFACPIFHYFGKAGFPWCEKVTHEITF